MKIDRNNKYFLSLLKGEVLKKVDILDKDMKFKQKINLTDKIVLDLLENNENLKKILEDI